MAVPPLFGRSANCTTSTPTDDSHPSWWRNWIATHFATVQAQSGHGAVEFQCPLSGVKRTRTSAVEFHPLYVDTITGSGRTVVAGRTGASG